MGLPWPPLPEPGEQCHLCKHKFRNQITPKYMYAQVGGVSICPLIPPGLPDVNGVHRLVQDPLNLCHWWVVIALPWGNIGYDLSWGPGGSVFFISSVPGFSFFGSTHFVLCKENYINQNICGVTPFAVASGGATTIYW